MNKNSVQIYYDKIPESLSVESLPGEIWKDIPGYEGLYQISNFARVKSLERVLINPNSKRRKVYYASLRILKQSGNEYKKVALANKRHNKYCSVHRLLAESFMPNPLNYKEVNHIDGNKFNNQLNNLEWCSRKQNAVHAFSTGLINKDKVRAAVRKNVKRASEATRKPIVKFSKDGVFVSEFRSLIDAANGNRFHAVNISKAALGKIKTAYGYRWEYKTA